MLFGFFSFAEEPFSTANDKNVNIQVIGNALSISIGSVGITAGSIVEIPDVSQVTLGTGSLTITGDANFSVVGNATSLNTGTVTVIAGATANVSGNSLTIATGNVTVTGTALVNPTGAQLIANTGEAGVITWNDIIPGVDMTWTPIEPF
jgi:hypothetical protein